MAPATTKTPLLKQPSSAGAVGSRRERCKWWIATREAKNSTARCGMPLRDGGWLDCQHCGGSGWLTFKRAEGGR